MNPAAEDRFKIYFTEKIWEMIPAIYRHEDGLAENPDVLRALVEIIAEQAALLRRSQDRLWEDQFIERCDEWAVPYIGDLLGTRLISALNKRGRRVDVAKTIYYRRRKGTVRILEELISDISGWEGGVVENFRRLGRTRHGLDPLPAALAGRFSGTLPGGFADLRRQAASELANSPFDEYHHTADVRRHKGLHGRYNIPKLAFYLYRLTAYAVRGSTPFSMGDDLAFTFDPSGRDIPLFARRNRTDIYNWDTWRPAYEWELPTPIRCRLLGHAEFEITESLIQKLVNDHGLSAGAADELRTLRGWRFKSEGRLRQTLETLGSSAELFADSIFLPLLHGALVDDCGKHGLLPGSPGKEASLMVTAGDPEGMISPERIQAGRLENWGSNAASHSRLVIDPERGRFLFVGDPAEPEVSVMYHYGFPGEVGAGTYDRRDVERCEPDQLIPVGGGALPAAGIQTDGVNQFEDSKTYLLNEDITGIEELTLQAANRERPYLRLQDNLVLQTLAGQGARLSMEGLWFGGEGSEPREMILQGEYECVVISHSTLDPGGDTDVAGNTIFPVHLVIEATVETMIIDMSITGPIFIRHDGLVEKLIVQDSIIQSVDPGVTALSINAGNVEMNRTTVFGALEVHRLQASETLITGPGAVNDTQNGCFRFSAAPAGSRLPRPYESFLFLKDTNHWFTSRRFGHPAYSQLSETAPLELRRGAENGSEIGVYNSQITPIKLDSLQAKVEEYMPFGLIPIFINET